MDKNVHEGHRERARQEFLQHGFSENTPPHKILELLLFYCVDRICIEIIIDCERSESSERMAFCQNPRGAGSRNTADMSQSATSILNLANISSILLSFSSVIP